MERGLIFDIDGVLVTSWHPMPGAADALRELRQLPHRFLTNTTSKTRHQIAETLAASGFDIDPDEILTAAKLTADYLYAMHPGKRVRLFNEGDIAADLAGVDLVDTDPEVIVLGGAGPGFGHAAFSEVVDHLLDGMPVIAMHRSLTWATDAGLRADTGLYLAGLERAVGRSLPTIGKPSPLGFRAAADIMGLEPSSVMMIGDDLYGDVLGAQAADLTGVLVRTGKFRAAALEAVQRDDFSRVPDHVIDSVADLPALLARLG